MHFDLTALDDANRYKLLASSVVPRPIAWITTLNEDGGCNAAPYSFFNVLAGTPAIVAVGIGPRADGGPKDTGRNILRGGEFVVNLVPAALADAMNVTAAEFAPGVSEPERAGLGLLPMPPLATPRIDGATVALACRLHQSIGLGPERMIVLGEAVAMAIHDDAVTDAARCHVDTAALDLIGRMGGAGGYVRTTDLFEMARINAAAWKETADAVASAAGPSHGGAQDRHARSAC